MVVACYWSFLLPELALISCTTSFRHWVISSCLTSKTWWKHGPKYTSQPSTRCAAKTDCFPFSFHDALNLSEMIWTCTHVAACLFNIRTNRDKWPWAENDFCHICSLVFTVHEPFLDFDVWQAVVFHPLRDGIVARFVATDGGVTRVYPRRYSPSRSPLPSLQRLTA